MTKSKTGARNLRVLTGTFVTIFLLSASVFSACSGDAVPAASGSAVSPDPGASEETIAAGAPRIEMIAQAYQGQNIIEVPQIISDNPTETISTLNIRMLDFAGDYGSFLAASDADSWLELKCYLSYRGDFVQIILTRTEYPTSDSYGEVMSVVYNYIEDQELSLAEAVAAAALDPDTPEAALLAAISEGMTIGAFRPAAFAITGEADAPYLFFFDVQLGTASEDVNGGLVLYLRYPDGSYVPYDGSSVASAFPDGSLLSLDPPLFWAQQAEG
jgi:hypothetical protein